MNRIGIVDLGSNSSRLVIYDIRDNGSYRPVYRMKKNIQLARHITEDTRMSPEGIHQAALSTRTFANVGRLYHVQEWIAVATAAIRQVENGDEVLERLNQEANLQFRLLSGDQEAWYGYLGVVNTMDVKDAVLVDIGGASTEIVQVRNRQFTHAVSLPYGALNLTRRFEHVESSLQGRAIFDFFRGQLLGVEWLRDLSNLPLIGTGGTMRAIGKIASKMQGSTMDRLHGYEVGSPTLQEIYEKVRSSTIEQRKKMGDLSDSRAEVIHTGVAVTSALATMIPADCLIVSGCGLREGLFYQFLLRDSHSPLLESVKEHNLHNFMQLYDVNMGVAVETADVAEKLFDDLAPFHTLSSEQKNLLRVSALLDMTGAFINVEKHTKHADYIVRSSHLYGFTQGEISDISLVILGKGAKPFKQLHLIVQLAKFLVLEDGLSYEDALVVLTTKLTTKKVPKNAPDVGADFKTVVKGFEKHFAPPREPGK